MKGLIIKDLLLMKMQKKFFIVVIALAIGMTFAMNNLSFISGYLTFLLPMFALSTVGYDEFDNGNAFLFTLPISRSGYAVEKYVISFLLGIGALLLSTLISLIYGIFADMSIAKAAMAESPAVFGAMLVITSVMLPIQIKFGAEKGRIIMIAVMGGAVAVGAIVGKFFEASGADVLHWADRLSNIKIGGLIALFVLIIALAVSISISVSIKIIKRKTF